MGKITKRKKGEPNGKDRRKKYSSGAYFEEKAVSLTENKGRDDVQTNPAPKTEET